MVRDPDPGDFAPCALVPDAPKFPVKGLGGCEILGATLWVLEILRGSLLEGEMSTFMARGVGSWREQRFRLLLAPSAKLSARLKQLPSFLVVTRTGRDAPEKCAPK